MAKTADIQATEKDTGCIQAEGPGMIDALKQLALARLRPLAALCACLCLFLFHGQAHADRSITSVTLNGGSSVTVLPGATITVKVNVTTTGSGTGNDWQSTSYRVSTASSGSFTCYNHSNTSSSGSYSLSYTITAPTTEGAYNLDLYAYSDNACSTGASALYSLPKAIVVTTPPTVSSIVRANSNPASSDTTIAWTVTFSKSVTGVTASDFTLVKTPGVSGASITSVTGSGSTWTVSANTGTSGNGGTLGLNLVDDDTITDTYGAKLGGSGTGNGNFTGAVYTISQSCKQPANTPSGLTLTCVCDNFSRSSLNPSTIFDSNWITSTSDSTKIVPDISSAGYLRLTNSTANNAKAASAPGAFPAKGNYISVEFQLYSYNGDSADGVGVTLSDYTVTPVPGAFGGSLGYAQKTGINGFAGGWIGVGIDEYGNYQNPSEGRVKGPGARAQSVAVRGSGSGTTGYPWLAGTAANISPQIDSPSSTTPAPGHQYQVIVDARNDPTSTSVAVNRDTGSGYGSLISLANIYTAAKAQGYTQTSVPTNWRLSFTGSTGTNMNIHEIGNVRICAQTIIPPTGGTATGFSAIDEAFGTAPNVIDFINGQIFMKVAGAPFKLNVAALNNNQIVTTYAAYSAKNVTLKLVDNSDGVCQINSAKANYCSSACTSKSAVTGGSQTLTFTAADAGMKMSDYFTINNAYQNLVAIISDSSVTACADDAFAVRPSGFTVTTSANNPASTGTPVFKAGSTPFTITATASASGYTGTPKKNDSLISALDPATGLVSSSWSVGALNGSFNPAISSVATGTSFTYGEVGAFQIAAGGIYDDDWASVDSNFVPMHCVAGSYSNTKDASGMYGCQIGSGAVSFGRFIPDHFTVASGSTVTPACVVGGFTYMDQPFAELKFDIEARNASDAKTQNYKGVLAKGTVTVVAENSDAGTNLGGRMSLPSGAAWSAGTYSMDAIKTAYFRRRTTAADGTDAPDGPYDSLQLGVFVTDPDGPKMNPANMNAAAVACGSACDSQRIGDSSTGAAQPTIVRFGRLKLSNAHGSDRLNLPIPMRAEYWNGTTFVTNTADNCTAIAKSNIALLNYMGGINTTNMPSGNLSVGNAFANGIGSLKLLRPKATVSSKGSVDVCVDLGTDNPEVCKATSANMPWLQGRWNGAGTVYDDDPKSRATFGVFKNANEFIYIREMY